MALRKASVGSPSAQGTTGRHRAPRPPRRRSETLSRVFLALRGPWGRWRSVRPSHQWVRESLVPALVGVAFGVAAATALLLLGHIVFLEVYVK